MNRSVPVPGLCFPRCDSQDNRLARFDRDFRYFLASDLVAAILVSQLPCVPRWRTLQPQTVALESLGRTDRLRPPESGSSAPPIGAEQPFLHQVSSTRVLFVETCLRNRRIQNRSEEHTSELQSLRH